MSNDILLRVEPDGIAVVTLNRPAKRNAVSLAMWRELGTIFADLARRADVRVAVLTGAGGHFCAGADISEFAT
ncbi:MAG: enoyl-CoA hydratase/isomerase family protein, partial [Alphaproteobacteria bacterium]|nr:enoyl-CoA hydratase/isomerase family protein [Alphaproteobacteria bacterium]